MMGFSGFVFLVLLLPALIVKALPAVELPDFELNLDLKEKLKDVLKDCRLAAKDRPCPDEDNFVQFHLFTRKNQKASQKVQVEERKDNLHKTLFNPDHPNKIIIHGFNPKLYKTELQAVKDAFLTKEEANVWMVNWSKLAAGGKCIVFSLRNTDHVAKCAAQLLRAIWRRAPAADVHVVADRAGNRVAHRLALEIKPRMLPRITGLNPEGGIVPTGNDVNKLAFWDAKFVDTIHSLPLLPSSDTFGHIDFYVNPGKLHQPGCEKEKQGKFVCDQRRAIAYFAESVTTRVGFVAWECSSYSSFALGVCNPHHPAVAMGNPCPNNATGIYITYTAQESPYALGPWEKALYREKGPKHRSDTISKYATQIKRQVELIEGSAPQLLKESGILDVLKTKFDVEAEDLKSVAIDLGLKGIRALADHYIAKKAEAEIVAKDITIVAQDTEKMAQDITDMAQDVIEKVSKGVSEDLAQDVTKKVAQEIDNMTKDLIQNVPKDVSKKVFRDETEVMAQEPDKTAKKNKGKVAAKEEIVKTAQNTNNGAQDMKENMAKVEDKKMVNKENKNLAKVEDTIKAKIENMNTAKADDKNKAKEVTGKAEQEKTETKAKK